MEELLIEAAVPSEKGRIRIRFGDGTVITLYKSELKRMFPQGVRFFHSEEETVSSLDGTCISEESYQKALRETVGLRVKKRAMHLLEQQDRTEYQLFEKLKRSGYPAICIEEAVAYVKKFGYIDDLRYAKSFVRYQQKKKSRQRLKTDLMAKGVKKEMIEQALDEEFRSDEQEKIRLLLEKRRYHSGNTDRKEMQRTYQYLMRRGFQSCDVRKAMHGPDTGNEYCFEE